MPVDPHITTAMVAKSRVNLPNHDDATNADAHGWGRQHFTTNLCKQSGELHNECISCVGKQGDLGGRCSLEYKTA